MDQARNMFIRMLLYLVDLVQMVKMYYYSSFKRDDDQLHKKTSVIDLHGHQLLVPIPLHCIAESVKDQLPVVQYQHFLKKRGQDDASTRGEDGDANGDNMCIVCWNRMEAREEVRELCNCCHAFHKKCLDAWIDEGQMICPLCRTKLLSSPKSDWEMGVFGGLGDPWRAERMIYLFGEEYLM